jgi:hypothetical protein
MWEEVALAKIERDEEVPRIPTAIEERRSIQIPSPLDQRQAAQWIGRSSMFMADGSGTGLRAFYFTHAPQT